MRFEYFGSIGLSTGETCLCSFYRRHVFLISLRMQPSSRLIPIHRSPNPSHQASGVCFLQTLKQSDLPGRPLRQSGFSSVDPSHESHVVFRQSRKLLLSQPLPGLCGAKVTSSLV